MFRIKSGGSTRQRHEASTFRQNRALLIWAINNLKCPAKSKAFPLFKVKTAPNDPLRASGRRLAVRISAAIVPSADLLRWSAAPNELLI
jgi:hypothetical protein